MHPPQVNVFLLQIMIPEHHWNCIRSITPTIQEMVCSCKQQELHILLPTGEVDFPLQVAVHPSATETVAAAHFEHGIHVIDAFISPSRPLAVLTRADVEVPRTLGLQPATERYFDASRWEELVPEISIMTVAEGLLTGRFDSGITALDVASEHPGAFRVEQELGSVDDPWIVYGCERASDGGVVAWPDSPASRMYRRALSR